MQVGTFITKLAKPFKNQYFASFWMPFITRSDFFASRQGLTLFFYMFFLTLFFKPAVAKLVVMTNLTNHSAISCTFLVLFSGWGNFTEMIILWAPIFLLSARPRVTSSNLDSVQQLVGFCCAGFSSYKAHLCMLMGSCT